MTEPLSRTLAVEHFVTSALTDALAAELIASGLISGNRLAERIESAAEGQDARRQEILLALARGFRQNPGPHLTVVDGGLT